MFIISWAHEQKPVQSRSYFFEFEHVVVTGYTIPNTGPYLTVFPDVQSPIECLTYNYITIVLEDLLVQPFLTLITGQKFTVVHFYENYQKIVFLNPLKKKNDKDIHNFLCVSNKEAIFVD